MLDSHGTADESSCCLLHSLFRDEEVVLIDVDLDARLATVEILQRLGTVLGSEGTDVSDVAIQGNAATHGHGFRISLPVVAVK